MKAKLIFTFLLVFVTLFTIKIMADANDRKDQQIAALKAVLNITIKDNNVYYLNVLCETDAWDNLQLVCPEYKSNDSVICVTNDPITGEFIECK